MQRSNLAVWTLVLLVGLLGGSLVRLRPVRAQSRPIDRPGDAIYTPTKLEWAALELQASYGQQWTSEDPLIINYLPLPDGKTVLCLLQYTSEVPAALVKSGRDSAQKVFDLYTGNRGWPWLRLEFQEKVLPRPPQ